MSNAKGTGLSNSLLGMILNGTSIANFCSAATTSALPKVSLQLHTANPTSAGDMTASEANYTSYARMGVERSSSGWTISGTTANLTSQVSFPACTGGSNTITYFSIGNSTVAASTMGTVYYFGTVSPNITVTNGITPILTTATVVSEN